MTPTNKGNYKQCLDCIFRLDDDGKKYPCQKSHSQVRGDIKYERDFRVCLLHEPIRKIGED